MSEENVVNVAFKPQGGLSRLRNVYKGPMDRVLMNPDRNPGPLTLEDIKAAVRIEVGELCLPAVSEAEMNHVIEATLYQMAQGITRTNGADLGDLGRFESITHEAANTYTYHPFGDPDDAA